MGQMQIGLKQDRKNQKGKKAYEENRQLIDEKLSDANL
jgi:hypothetical protein